jgi:hypothetical protein
MPLSQDLQHTAEQSSENYFLAYRDFASQLAVVSQNNNEVIGASMLLSVGTTNTKTMTETNTKTRTMTMTETNRKTRTKSKSKNS